MATIFGVKLLRKVSAKILSGRTVAFAGPPRLLSTQAWPVIFAPLLRKRLIHKNTTETPFNQRFFLVPQTHFSPCPCGHFSCGSSSQTVRAGTARRSADRRDPTRASATAGAFSTNQGGAANRLKFQAADMFQCRRPRSKHATRPTRTELREVGCSSAKPAPGSMGHLRHRRE